jgi:hypothetical protein
MEKTGSGIEYELSRTSAAPPEALFDVRKEALVRLGRVGLALNRR